MVAPVALHVSLVADTTPVAPVTGLGDAGAPGSPGVGAGGVGAGTTGAAVTVTESNVETLRTDTSALVTTSPV